VPLCIRLDEEAERARDERRNEKRAPDNHRVRYPDVSSACGHRQAERSAHHQLHHQERADAISLHRSIGRTNVERKRARSQQHQKIAGGLDS
jgi:hypothetical protein